MLEAEQIVERVVYPEIPPRVEYHLTPKGRDLLPVVEALRQFGEKWTSS
jgi:DNA-binding HxlR family transcriptional regulator